MSTLFCKKIGTGPPLVFLHGFCETHQIWDSLVDRLSSHFTIFLIDLPGFGASQPWPEVNSIDEVANSVANELDSFKVRNPVVIGHSLGGYVALAMQRAKPGFSAGIVLFHSTIFADSAEKKSNRDKTIEFVIEHGVAPFVKTFVPNLFHAKDHEAIPTMFSIAYSTPLKTLISYTKAMRDRPSYEHLTGYKSLILAGKHDAIIPLAISQKMADLLKKSTLVVLQSSSHMGMFEDPASAQASIKHFATACFGNE